MAVNTMPKAYKYFIVYGDGELELTTDPKGWQEHSIGFTRSEDFGLNVEVVVPLSFSGAGRLKLKQLYEATGVFTKANIRIEKRNPITWVLETFYTYRLDFKTYKDNLRYVEISGIEDGLLSKFQTYKDTEYEIPLPSSGKSFLDYYGVTVTKKNIIQCSFGELKEKSTIAEDAYILGGSRAVRAYNDSIVFTDVNGLPFETMTFRCVKDTTFSLKIELELNVIANGTLWNPATGYIKFVKHNANFGSPTVLTNTVGTQLSYGAASTSVDASRRNDFFNSSATQTITLTSGQYVSVFYYADNGAYDSVSVDNAFNTYIEMSNSVVSALQNYKIEVFTYEWLIGKLLNKIADPITPTFNFGITYPNFKPMLSATPCIKNMGSASGENLKVKLSDVLKSLNVLEKIGIDIDGNVFTINSRNAFYSNSNAGLITANNIVVNHDEKHQYGKITVGYDVDKMSEDSDLVYPFNCKKEFEIVDTTVDAEIDLTNPFKADPYDIDKYIQDTLNLKSNQENCDFIIFAVKDYTIAAESYSIGSDVEHSNVGSSGAPYITYKGYNNTEVPSEPNIFFSETGAFCSFDEVNTIKFTVPQTGEYRITLKINANVSDPTSLFRNTNLINNTLPNYKLITTDYESQVGISYDGYERNLDVLIDMKSGAELIFNLEFMDKPMNVSVSKFELTIENTDVTGSYLYKSHTITNHNGNTETLYNVPITAKRILQKHLDYLSLSNYGNENDIKFIKSYFISAITSKCGFEASNVVENADIESITPMFLPCTIECDTVQYYNSDFSDNKYKYIQVKDEKSGKIYEGWINSLTFDPARPKSNKLILQAKKI